MIIFARHGETQYNSEDRLQGLSDSPLTDNGRLQAERIGNLLMNFNPDIAYTSPLKRVYDTFKIMTKSSSVPFIVREELSEICYGEWETRRKTELKKNILWHTREKDPFNFVHPGIFRGKAGESYQQLQLRLAPLFEELLGVKDRTILILSHLGVMRCVYNYFKKPLLSNSLKKIPNNMIFAIKPSGKKGYLREILV